MAPLSWLGRALSSQSSKPGKIPNSQLPSSTFLLHSKKFKVSLIFLIPQP